MIATEILHLDVGDRIFKIKAVKDIDSLLKLVDNDDDVPFWAVLWPAAIGMAKFLWNKPELAGQNILELGAGLGLSGVVAAARGGTVCQTDFVPEALTYCEFNASLNEIGNINRYIADWRDFDIQQQFDFIIGSDVLYEPTLHPYLEQIFLHNLNPDGKILLSDPGRKDAEIFIAELSEKGFEVSCDKFDIEDGGLNYCVRVYTLSPSRR